MKRQTTGVEQNGEFVDVPVRVRYADTDMMGIVYYGSYPAYFEIGRSEYMREKGFTYREFEALGYHLVVVGMEAKYYNSATYDDLLIVKTRISELQSRGLAFHYIIYRDETIIVEGRTKHLCVNANKKPVVIPPLLLNVLRNVKVK
ncbi:MAG TPA: thioesterase family protein [Syntrophorhabdaceae bacterium]|nr:thioesterase family protein [Syntrophorhabdaceae bacterium]